MYVQAAKASPSNRMIIEKDLWNSAKGRARITKVRDRQKYRKRVLVVNDGPDVNLASSIGDSRKRRVLLK